MLIKNERGSALILTIVIMLVLLILGGALVMYGFVEVRRAHGDEQELQAYYLARSAADAVAQQIIDHPDVYADLKNKGPSQDLILENIEGKVSVEVAGEGNDLIISSLANVGDKVQKISLTLKSESLPFEADKAIFAASAGSRSEPAIEFKGTVKVYGTLGTNSYEEGSISMAWSAQIFPSTPGADDGHLLVGSKADEAAGVIAGSRNPVTEHVPKGEIRKMESNVEIPPVQFPDFPQPLPRPEAPIMGAATINITEDTPEILYYENISFGGGVRLTINLNDRTQIMVVDDLNIRGEIVLNRGPNKEGKLLLYLHSAALTNEAKVNMGGDLEALTIYYDGVKPFGAPSLNHKGDNYRLTGNLLVKEASVVVGSSCIFNGNIFSAGSDVKVSGAGGVKGMIYAPDAHINIQNSGFTGAVVASRLSASGNVEIRFDKSDINTDLFPEGAIGPEGEGGSKFTKFRWSIGK